MQYRKDKKGRDLLCAVNFSPNTYEDYRIGVPAHRQYRPIFNTDAEIYGGDGFGDAEPVKVEAIPSHGKEQSAAIKIPAFGAVFLRGEGTLPKPKKAGKAEESAENAPAEEEKISVGQKAVQALKSIRAPRAAKAEETEGTEVAPEARPAKRRGRKPKTEQAPENPAQTGEEAKPVRRRGRKPKAEQAAEKPMETGEETKAVKKRGRRPKTEQTSEETREEKGTEEKKPRARKTRVKKVEVKKPEET